MYLIVIGWLYVALMMAVTEATSSTGSVLGAIFTFLLYGVGPVALVVYIMRTPSRKQALKAREQAEHEAQQARSAEPDARGEAAADAIAPVRKES
jgi:mannose/fructose/N-acetylgalactosamine-specific phosphotransferase system component IID